MVEVFVPKIVIGLNEHKGQHWSYYHRIKKGWLNTLRLMLRTGEHNNEFRYVEIIAYHDSRRNFLDDDNFRGGCKPVVDCLKNLGWIKDDSLNWVKVEYDQKTKGEDGTTETGTRIQIRGQKDNLLCSVCVSALLGEGLNPFFIDHGVHPQMKGRCCVCGATAACAVVVHVWRV